MRNKILYVFLILFACLFALFLLSPKVNSFVLYVPSNSNNKVTDSRGKIYDFGAIDGLMFNDYYVFVAGDYLSNDCKIYLVSVNDTSSFGIGASAGNVSSAVGGSSYGVKYPLQGVTPLILRYWTLPIDRSSFEVTGSVSEMFSYEASSELSRIVLGNVDYLGSVGTSWRSTSSVGSYIGSTFQFFSNNTQADSNTFVKNIDGSPSYLAITEEDLSGLTSETINIVPMAGTSISLKLVNSSNTLFSISFDNEKYQEYYRRTDLDNPFSVLGYCLPWSVLPSFTYIEGEKYDWQLTFTFNGAIRTLHYEVTSTYSGDVGDGKGGNTSGVGGSSPDVEESEEVKLQKEQLETQKEQLETEKEQLETQKEQLETSKGIWGTLMDLLSYINPFSENFFVYKLIELLIEAIKSLFIPRDGFFNDFIADVNDWLSDRLGILYYPIDIVIDFLTRIGNIKETGTAVISWNSFEFMGATLIPSGSYDMFSLINENSTFKNVHSIYLVFVDVIMYLALVVFAYNTFADIFGGKYIDGDDISDAYNAYQRYQKNQKKIPIGFSTKKR